MINRIAIGASASGSPVFVGGKTYGFGIGTTGDFDVPLTGLTEGSDTSPSLGDLVLVYFSTGSATNRDLQIFGYTEIVELYSSDTYDTNLLVAYKFMATSGDLTEFTVVGGSRSVEDGNALAIQVWRDVGTPALAGSLTETNTVRFTAPAATPTAQGSIIVVGGGGGYSAAAQTYTDNSALTNWQTLSGSDTYDTAVGLGYKAWTGGTFTPSRVGVTVGDTTSGSCASATLIIPPL
jgi:hypothetical protein